VFLCKVQPLLKPFTFSLVLNIFVAELYHLATKSLQLNLFVPPLLLNNYCNSQRFLKSAVQLPLLSKKEISFFNEFIYLTMQKIKGLSLCRSLLHFGSAILVKAVKMSAQKGHLVK
jgi:hypothetical protein